MKAGWLDIITPIAALVFMVGIWFLTVIYVANTNPFLSRDEICQKNFGKDYVYIYNGRSADFCVDGSGIPKYPKTWNEREPNA